MSEIHGPTPEELEVAKLLGKGMTQDEVAARLNVSPRTVKGHCESMRRKLGVSKTRYIPRILKELGLIE